jgi:hypothetical protein
MCELSYRMITEDQHVNKAYARCPPQWQRELGSAGPCRGRADQEEGRDSTKWRAYLYAHNPRRERDLSWSNAARTHIASRKTSGHVFNYKTSTCMIEPRRETNGPGRTRGARLTQRESAKEGCTKHWAEDRQRERVERDVYSQKTLLTLNTRQGMCLQERGWYHHRHRRSALCHCGRNRRVMFGYGTCTCRDHSVGNSHQGGFICYSL